MLLCKPNRSVKRKEEEEEEKKRKKRRGDECHTIFILSYDYTCELSEMNLY